MYYTNLNSAIKIG